MSRARGCSISALAFRAAKKGALGTVDHAGRIQGGLEVGEEDLPDDRRPHRCRRTVLRLGGEDGAGHFVKMVHNGIEYGDMQLICETYQMMKAGLGMSNEQMAESV